MTIKTIITDVDQDLEGVLAHIRAVLEKDPKAPIHINPEPPKTITVGTANPASATPTHGAGGTGKGK